MNLPTSRPSVAVLLLLAACGGGTPAAAPAPVPARPAPVTPEVGGDGGAERPYELPAWPAFEAAVARGTRTRTGEPGPRYWQQSASYRLEAELIPLTKRLIGKGTVTYRNHSPDTLPVLYVHAYPNLYAPNARRNTEVMSALGGIVFTRVGVEGTALDSVAAGPGWTLVANGTVMELRLPRPLAPRQEVTLDFAWNYRVPPDGAPRGGQDREAYLLSYWYPQVAVYDDVNGWQADPYLGNAEFYMGYADYEVAYTVPAGWLVASTGELVNAAEVLAPAVRERLARARSGPDVVRVVGDTNRGAGRATATGTDGKLTWRFRATNVRDVTWGTSALWLWDAAATEVGDATGDGVPDTTLAQAFYRPDRRRGGWGDAAKWARHALGLFSGRLGPYPWSHMDVVDGPGSCGGMEYPMLTCIGGSWDPPQLYETMAHEIAHMWFPMMVGSDEKRFAWQDEGMAQHFQAYAVGDQFPGSDDLGESRRYYLQGLQAGETEMMRHGDRFSNPFQYAVASYYKPAAVLEGLRAALGDSTFTAAFREYGRRWAWKHPTPRDFFNTVSSVAGRDLDWFWRSWYHETWRLDQALDEVELAGDSARVTVTSKGRVPMPVLLVARGTGGDSTTATIPVEAFLNGARTATITMPVPKGVVRLEIDPGRRMPDAEPLNQSWPKGGAR